MDPDLIKLALAGLVLLVCIGLFFGIGLALAARKFAVTPDAKVEEALDVLAGAQCGGCGYAGCEAYAEAVVSDADVPPDLCFPGKQAVSEALAEITGKQRTLTESAVASVRCTRVEGRVSRKFDYLGYGTCTAAVLAFGGPQACSFACIGLGECVDSCVFDAITMVDGMPRIDPDACLGCSACARVCPTNTIEMIPVKARVWVPCKSQDPAKIVKQVCKTGCIPCQKCVKVCPANAVWLEDNVVVIDHQKCLDYGPECEQVCVEKCPRKILRTFQPESIRDTVEAKPAAAQD